MNNRNSKFFIISGIQILLFTSLIVGLGLYLSNNKQSVSIKANANTVSLSIYPPKIENQHPSVFSVTPVLVSKEDKKVGYIQTVIMFDATHLNLTEIDFSLMDSSFEALSPFDQSFLDNANNTGIINILLGAFDVENVPKETVQFPKLIFKTLKESDSAITINTQESQIVFLDETIAEIETNAAIINSHFIPTPTNKPTISNEQIPNGIEPTQINIISPTVFVSESTGSAVN